MYSTQYLPPFVRAYSFEVMYTRHLNNNSILFTFYFQLHPSLVMVVILTKHIIEFDEGRCTRRHDL
jgi:hypothetical protein